MASSEGGAVDVEIRACGIPCIARVTRHFVKKPDPSCKDSDMDFMGYTELEYDILDRRGRPAPWLERKVDAVRGAREAIDEQVLLALEPGDSDE